MRYDIGLSIDYRYDHPSDRARGLMRLLPRPIAGIQRLIDAELVIDPAPDTRHELRDFFGNRSTSASWHEPLAQLKLTLRARVERLAEAPSLDLSPPLHRLAAELADVRDLGPLSPHHYVGATPRIAPDPSTAGFARDQLTPGASALDAVRGIGAALHREMRFDPTATDVATPPARAFAQRRGVCQDFTQVMISCLRGIGIPAGYASGFLRTLPPPGQPRLEGADAMHAWVRAWCGGGTGWIDYDPTNDCLVGLDHVTVAQGRDYSDVSPVRGAHRGLGSHSTAQRVDMVAL